MKSNRNVALAILNIIGSVASFVIGALLIINSINNFKK